MNGSIKVINGSIKIINGSNDIMIYRRKRRGLDISGNTHIYMKNVRRKRRGSESLGLPRRAETPGNF